MKKILVAVMAVMMTMSMMAQCPKDKSGCPMQGAEGCKIKKECVYTPETRAMMNVDRIARVVKDLTEAERKSLVDFYVAHFFKVEKRKETANPMTREECIKECNAELRKVLGDERYIQYLEGIRAKKMDCEMRPMPHGPRGERPMGCPQGGRPVGCHKK